MITDYRELLVQPKCWVTASASAASASLYTTRSTPDKVTQKIVQIGPKVYKFLETLHRKNITSKLDDIMLRLPILQLYSYCEWNSKEIKSSGLNVVVTTCINVGKYWIRLSYTNDIKTFHCTNSEKYIFINLCIKAFPRSCDNPLSTSQSNKSSVMSHLY